MFAGWEEVRMLKAGLGSSQRLSHSIYLRKWDAQIPGRAGPFNWGLKLLNYKNQTKLGARLRSSTIMPMGGVKAGFTKPRTVLKEKWQEYSH